ncbi:MAG TPA: hypothetical protein VGK02_04520 [Candidatus Aquicultor sp.]|jgi:hypothetical protein
MKKVLLGSALVVMLALLPLLNGCAQADDKQLLGGKRGIKGQETKVLRETNSIAGLTSQYLKDQHTLVFERADTLTSDSSIYSLKNGVEILLFAGTSPSISEIGLYFITPDGVCVQDEFKKVHRLRLNNEFYSVAASPSGDRLMLVKPVSDGVNALYLYDVKMTKLTKLELPKELNPDNPSWASEDELFFDASVNYATLNDPDGLPHNVYSLKLDETDATPRLILSDHNSPSLSPKGDMLACIESNPTTGNNTVAIFDIYNVTRIAYKKLLRPNMFYESPITWLSEDKFAVTEVNSEPPEATTIKIFEMVKKSREPL